MNHYVNILVKQYNKYLKETANSTLEFFEELFFIVLMEISHFLNKMGDVNVFYAYNSIFE